MEKLLEVWRRVATDLKPAHLEKITTTIGLDGLPAAFSTLLAAGAKGRYVVKV